MSTIFPAPRTQYRAKLQRPAVQSVSCANSSQVRRLIDKVLKPQPLSWKFGRGCKRAVAIGSALSLFALASTLASKSGTALPNPAKPRLVSTFVLGQEEPNIVLNEYQGTIVPIKKSELGFLKAGRIRRVFVSDGEVVQAGALLAELDNSAIHAELAVARTELKLAESRLKATQTSYPTPAIVRRRSSWAEMNPTTVDTFDAAHTLVDHWTSIIKRLELEIDECQMRAPYGAVVAQTYLSDGSVVTSNQPVVKIISRNDIAMRVTMPIAQSELLRNTHPGVIFCGDQKVACELKAVLPEVNEVEQTRDVLFQVPEATLSKLYTQAILQLELPGRKIGYRVPLTALHWDKSKRPSVWLLQNDSSSTKETRSKATVSQRPVDVLQTLKDSHLVQGDLQPGNRILSVAPKKVRKDQPVWYSDSIQQEREAWAALLK